MNELLKDRRTIEDGFADSSNAEIETSEEETLDLAEDNLSDTYIDPDTQGDANFNRRVADDSPLQPNALFAGNELHQFRSNWDRVQGSFVDEPRTAVQQADALVADVVNRITEQFASERGQLEQRWARGEDANTEELRQTFKRYRAFFDRLLSFQGDELSTAGTSAAH